MNWGASTQRSLQQWPIRRVLLYRKRCDQHQFALHYLSRTGLWVLDHLVGQVNTTTSTGTMLLRHCCCVLPHDQAHLARCLHERCLACRHCCHSANSVQNWTVLCVACFDMSGRERGPTGQLRSARGSVSKRTDIRIIALLLAHGADPNGASPSVSNHDIVSNMLSYQIWY